MLDFISEHGSATIKELKDKFKVSEMTIHRDLNNLEATGRIRKTYGGVVVTDTGIETDFDRRLQMNRNSKICIGEAAAKLVEDGDSLFLGPSSTVYMMLPDLIQKNNLTIITTSTMILARLSSHPNIEVYSTGGLVYDSTAGLIGPTAVDFIKNIHVDKYFLGATGVTSGGTTDPLSLIVEVKQAMAKHSNENILLVDYTKFGRLSRFNLLPFSDIDLIVTDAEMDSPYIKEILSQAVEFLFCKSENN
ncbi:MAG: DeoR/GlpR family DNA-binding transcription regulator [Anaerolineales bacterium]|jgi:DeoR family myo-inositol catabolism operon transcriptional repressor